MRKFLFSMLLFISCLFLGLTFNSTEAKATLNVYSVTASSNSNRVIKVGVEGLHSTTTEVRISEIEYCYDDTPEGCQRYDLVNETTSLIEPVYFKKLNTASFPVSGQTSVEVNYTITATSDGKKDFFIDTEQGIGDVSTYYAFFDYVLSTLEERVVVNPSSNGTASHVYGGVQYVAVRQINIKVELLDAEKTVYSGETKICEVINVKGSDVNSYCSDYAIGESDTLDYDLKSFGDGLKKIMITLYKFENGADPLNVQREIYLDTIGPEITIEGGTWVFLKSGTRYKAQKATCQDALFPDDECTVENDAEVVDLKYNTDKYQFVTYSATDRLGNTRTVSVKIKVEQAVKETNYLPFIIGGAIFLVVLLILGWILIKNHEKKKKISYI